MKYLITTIAAILLIGCGSSPDHSGTYILSNSDKDPITLELKPDGSFTGMPKSIKDDRAIGSWKLEGELLICEGTTEKSSKKVVFKFNKTTKKLISLSADGKEMPIEDEIPEGEDGLYLKELSQAESQSTETFTEAANPEPPTGKAPEIPIHEAAELGEIEAVKQHLAAGTDVNAKEANGETPLHLAAATGDKKIGELLIANGADVNAKDDVGVTPLMVPATKEIAELLIAKGADVNAKDDNGDTALDSAIQYKQTEIADLLRKHGGKHGTIHGAAYGGDIEAVKGFLAAGADVDAKGGDGRTPLWFAAHSGNKEIGELLIAKGADVNAKDANGETPLDWAKRHPETADLLRKHGAKTAEELKAEGK